MYIGGKILIIIHDKTEHPTSDVWCGSFRKYQFKLIQLSFLVGFYSKIMFWVRWFYSLFERIFAELAMSQRWSAIFCETGTWGGKPIGRVRVSVEFQNFLKRIRTGPYSSAAQKGHLYLLSMWQNRAKNEKRKWKRHQKVRRLLCPTRWVWTASRPKREKSQKRRSSIGRCKSFFNLIAPTARSKTVSFTFL